MRQLTAVLSKLDASPAGDAPALELGEVKRQRRVTSSTLDDLFVLWIQAATAIFEEQTDRQIMDALFEYALDGTPSSVHTEIELPKPPLRSVESITYLDSDEEEQTWATSNYDVVIPSGIYGQPGRVVLRTGCAWPTVANRSRALRITYRAGYAESSTDVPAIIKACLLFLVGHFHKYGEEVQDTALHTLPLGAETMMRAFRYSAKSSTVLWQD